MKSFHSHHAWLIVTLLLGTLACRLVSRIGETKATVEAAATQAKQGLNMVETARAMITQVGSSEMLKTAQAIATEVGESGLLQTAQAVATQEGPGLMETAKALATQKGPGLEETARSFMGEPPDDIPILDGEKDNYLAGEFMVSYAVSVDFEEVVDFYRREMPDSGWTEEEQTSIESDSVVTITFHKGPRKASVTISVNPINRKTTIVVLITGQ